MDELYLPVRRRMLLHTVFDKNKVGRTNAYTVQMACLEQQNLSHGLDGKKQLLDILERSTGENTKPDVVDRLFIRLMLRMKEG